MSQRHGILYTIKKEVFMRSFLRVAVIFNVLFAITLFMNGCTVPRVFHAPSPPCRLEIPPGHCIRP